jgi:hypothetical protein
MRPTFSLHLYFFIFQLCDRNITLQISRADVADFIPGIKSLNDREFIRAFQVIDEVIQNNQPLFVAG